MNGYIGENIRFVIRGQRKIGSKKKKERNIWLVGDIYLYIYIFFIFIIESNFPSYKQSTC